MGLCTTLWFIWQVLFMCQNRRRPSRRYRSACAPNPPYLLGEPLPDPAGLELLLAHGPDKQRGEPNATRTTSARWPAKAVTANAVQTTQWGHPVLKRWNAWRSLGKEYAEN